MKFTRTIALLAGTVLFLAACNKESDQTAIEENTNPLLAHVPADTPYVLANLEFQPEEVTDAFIERFQPVIELITRQTVKFNADYASGRYEDNMLANLAAAVLEEMGGSINGDGLESLGISLQSHHAVYGMGIFPVFRFEVGNATALRQALARIETKVGFVLPVKELNGATYWRITEDNMPVGLYIAILDQQLAVSLFPVSAEDTMLAAFLGQEMPVQSLASTNALAIMNSQKGYTGYGSGMVDLQKIADELLTPESETYSYFGANSPFDPASLDETCVAEARAMIANAPRMTFGTTKLTTSEWAVSYQLELESVLAAALSGLVSDTPVATDDGQLFTASLAVQVGKLRTFVLEKANAIVAAPFECEQLQELNANAQQLAQQLNIPMPPMVNNLMGLRISIDDFNQDFSKPEGKGLLALHVDKPEMFVGMASMMVPGFDELDLANQTEPVRIPSKLMHIENLEVFALLNKSAIGLAIGDQEPGKLSNFMDAKSQADGTFFSVAYDSARQLELNPAMLNNWGVITGDTDAVSELESEFDDSEFKKALKKSYVAMLGNSRWEMRFTKDGLVIDSSMTFK